MLPYSYTSEKPLQKATLADCVQEFLAMPKSSKGQEGAHKYGLKYFEEFAAQLNKQWITEFDISHIQQFVNQLQLEKGQAASTVHNRYRAVQSFFGYLENRYREFRNPCFRIKLPKLPMPDGSDGLTEAEIRKIKEFLPSLNNPSISLKFDIAFDIAARPMDLRNATVAHLDLENGYIKNLLRKGGFYQTMPISDETAHNVKLYLPIRQRLLKDSGIFRFESLPQEIQDEYPLFPSIYRAKFKDRFKPEQFKLSAKGIHDRLVLTAAKAGVIMNPMMIRHTVAQEHYNQTKDLNQTRQLLGHTTTAMTIRYATNKTENIKKHLETTTFRRAA